jgi:hypothetical protein
MEFLGKVVRKPLAAGSKSERLAVCIEGAGGNYVIRREQGNPFHDPQLEALVGKTIKARGSLVGDYTLLMSHWTEL